MKNKLNKISFVSLVATFPLSINCTLTHYCMCGHNAHGQLSDNIFQYMNDLMLFLLFALSLGLSLYDKRYKLGYYLYIFFTLLMIQLLSFMGLVLYPFIFFLHKNYHKNTNEENKRKNNVLQ